MSESKWELTLSVTDRNNIGLIQPRKNNTNSELMRVHVTNKNGEPYDLTALKVFFVTHFSGKDSLSVPVQKETKVLNAKEGIIEFTLDEDCMQKVGRQEAYFEIYDYDKFLDSTQNFTYEIISSSRNIKADFTPYIETWQEVEKMLNEGAAKTLTDKTEKLELQKANVVDVNEQMRQQKQETENKLDKKTDNETFVAMTADMQRQIENTQSGMVGEYNSESELRADYPNGTKGYAVVWLSENNTKVGYSYTYKNETWTKGQVWNGIGISDRQITTSKLSSELLMNYDASKLVFRWGSVDANTGELNNVNNYRPEGIRGVSYLTKFNKGTNFSLRNRDKYQGWLNIFSLSGIFIKSVILTTTEEWTLEDDSLIYIVVGKVGNISFDAQDLKIIQANINIKSSTIDYENKFPKDYVNVDLNKKMWRYITVNADNGNELRSNNRLTTDFIFVTKGSIIHSENPESGQWAVAFFNIKKQLNSEKRKVFGNSYLDYLVEEDGYVKITIANSDDSNINISDEVTNLVNISMSSNSLTFKMFSEMEKTEISTNLMEYVYGSGNANTGELGYGGKSRIRTLNKHRLKKGTLITGDPKFLKYAVYCYDTITGEFKYRDSMVFSSDRTQFYINSDCDVAFVLAKSDDSKIESIAELSKLLKIDVDYDTYNMIINTSFNDEKNNMPFVSGFIDYQPISFYSSLIFDHKDMWGFYPSEDDHSDFKLATKYRNINGEWQSIQNFKHNWGHVNTANYAEKSDWLIMATGNIGDTAEHSKKFWVLENFSSKTKQETIDISELVEFDTKHLGFNNPIKNSVAVQPLFGEPNDLINNIIYLLWNDGEFKYISKVLLGVGTNNLGNGTFIPDKNDGQLNGTMKLLKTFKGSKYTDYVLTQDAIWFNGYIYEMLGHDGLFYNKIRLDNVNNLFIEEQFQEKMYTPTGDDLGCVNNGAAILDNKLYTTLTIGNDVRKTVLVSRILT